jgi:hypothetical protein
MATATKFDAKMDLGSGFDRFSPENIATNRPIVDREPLTLSLSQRWLAALDDFRNCSSWPAAPETP